MSYCFVIKILNSSWVSQIIAGGFSGGWLKGNSGVCGIYCSTAETSIEFHIPLQKSYMLFALTGSPQQNKKMLREDSEFLQKKWQNLFGKNFRENIRHRKANIKMISSTSRIKYKWFCLGLPQTPRRSFGAQHQHTSLLRKEAASQYSKKQYNNRKIIKQISRVVAS